MHTAVLLQCLSCHVYHYCVALARFTKRNSCGVTYCVVTASHLTMCTTAAIPVAVALNDTQQTLTQDANMSTSLRTSGPASGDASPATARASAIHQIVAALVQVRQYSAVRAWDLRALQSLSVKVAVSMHTTYSWCPTCTTGTLQHTTLECAVRTGAAAAATTA
jgi:hypothetical protein